MFRKNYRLEAFPPEQGHNEMVLGLVADDIEPAPLAQPVGFKRPHDDSPAQP
jgi:hypothetical protein